MLKSASRLLMLGVFALVLGVLPLAAAELTAAPHNQGTVLSACNSDSSLTVDLEALLAEPSQSIAEREQNSPLFMTCSGDNCGCYDDNCTEECGPPPNPCHTACRRAQVQCAICCCTPEEFWPAFCG